MRIASPPGCGSVAQLDHRLGREEGSVDGAHVDEHAVVVVFVTR